MKIRTRNARIIVSILALGLLVAGGALAQVSGSIQANGTVLTPLSMSGTNLQFGNSIFPGMAKSVTRTEGTAGTFTVNGEAGREFTATFTLPENLTNGGNNLPVSFSTTDGGYKATNDQATAASFNPAGLQTWVLSETGACYVWIGGTVSPAFTQAPGAYSGTIGLDVQYTGN